MPDPPTRKPALAVFLIHVAAAVGALALTTLVRSSYHPALLVPVIALACAAARKQKEGHPLQKPGGVPTWRRILAISVLIALVPLAWCAKKPG